MNKIKIFAATIAVSCLAIAGGFAAKSLTHDMKKDSQVSKSSISVIAKGEVNKPPCVCPKTAQCP